MANGNHKVEITVGVKDLATAGLKKISGAVGGMSKDIGKAGSALGSFNRNLDGVIGKMDKLANSMYRFNMQTSGIQRSLRNIGAVGAIGGGALVVDSANKAIDFEKQMYKMQTRMQSSDSVRNDLSKYILGLNSQVGFSAGDLGNMAVTLGSAGINTSSGMKGALKSTSYFAESVDAVPEEAANMIISASKGFGIAMENSMSIADKLTVALNNSQLKVEELPHAIGELSGRSKMLGQSLDSSLVALMSARDQGLPAAQAAQNLIHGLTQLSSAGRPDLLTPKRAATLEKMGVSTNFFDMNKKQLKEFPDLVAEFEKQMEKQGLMPNKADFYKKIQDNNGIIPDDIVNKMQAMPLLSKVLGISGQTPFIMGLQAKYDKVDKNTGQTTETYYGADALKKMRDDVKNSTGAVEAQHKKMAQTTKFALDQLGSSWENAQIKLMNDFLPAIRVASGVLTDFIDGKNVNNGFDRINSAIDGVSANLSKTSPELAKFFSTISKGAVGTVRISYAMGPTAKQIGGAATDDLVNGDWGSSIFTLPYHVVKNGGKFIKDTLSGNAESDKAISQLPPEMQDTAKLTRSLIQGGVVLLAAGAIIKVIELAIRTASTTLKAGKIATSLADTIIKLITGGIKGKKAGDVVGGALENLKKNMAINANIVNVYGKVVNNGGRNIPGGNTPGNRPMPRDTPRNIPGPTSGKPGEPVPRRLPMPKLTPSNLAKGTLVSVIAGETYVGLNQLSDRSRELTKHGAHGPTQQNVLMNNQPQHVSKYIPPKQQTFSKPENQALQGYLNQVGNKVSTSIKTNNDSIVSKLNVATGVISSSMNNTSKALSSGLSNVSASIRNIKVNNNVNVSFSPNINVNGVGNHTPTVSEKLITNNGPSSKPKSGIQQYMDYKKGEKIALLNNRRHQ